MAWPYHASVLTGAAFLDFYKGDLQFEGRCVDGNNYYDRTDLYPGWKCLTDMDCASKKCREGKCIGRKEEESCGAHKDCETGLYCDLNRATNQAPAVCKQVKGYGDSCK